MGTKSKTKKGEKKPLPSDDDQSSTEPQENKRKKPAGGVIRFIRSFIRRVIDQLFQRKRHIKLGLYGPPNSGKSTLANRICKDWLGEKMSVVSKIPHETRHVTVKEKVNIKADSREMTFNIVDTPGIATKIDYEEFMKFSMSEKQAKQRAKEATRGVIESIKWLDDMDCVAVILDATENPYSQVNITIIGNLAARDSPVLIVANKMDLKKASLRRVENAFPQYDVVGVSAERGSNMEEFYESLARIIR